MTLYTAKIKETKHTTIMGPIISNKKNFNRLRCHDKALSINEANASGLCWCCDPEWNCYLKKVNEA